MLLAEHKMTSERNVRLERGLLDPISSNRRHLDYIITFIIILPHLLLAYLLAAAMRYSRSFLIFLSFQSSQVTLPALTGLSRHLIYRSNQGGVFCIWYKRQDSAKPCRVWSSCLNIGIQCHGKSVGGSAAPPAGGPCSDASQVALNICFRASLSAIF